MCSLHLVVWGLAVGAAPEAGGARVLWAGAYRDSGCGPRLRNTALLQEEQVRPVPNHYFAQRVWDAAGEGAEELKAFSRKLNALLMLGLAPAAGFLVGFLAGAWRLISELWRSHF